MDERAKQKAEAALRRQEEPGRPLDLSDHAQRSETLADDYAFKRPLRAEHTSEKEHPPGKE